MKIEIVGAENIEEALREGWTARDQEIMFGVRSLLDDIGDGDTIHPFRTVRRGTMFVCGNDAQSRAAVIRLGEETGLEMIDAGPLANVRLLEPLAMLWTTLACRQGMKPELALELWRQ